MRGFLLGSVLALAACAAASEPAETTTDEVKLGELPLDIDAKSLLRELTARGVKSKTEALALLPRPFKQRFVLVTDTGGLGMSSRARPRIIHFTEDAKLLIGTSGHSLAEDMTANSFELLEHDDATHAYRTHTLTFDPVAGPQMTENDTRCAACHGESGHARPVWGSYPNWPSAYGGTQGHDGVDDMTPDELADFKAFVEVAKTDPDYRHLEIHTNVNGFVLATPYGNPNTLFGNVVGNRQAADLHARMAASPLYDQLAYALVADSIRCDLSPAVEQFIDRLYNAQSWPAGYPARQEATKMFRLLGVEPTTDLHLANTVTTPADPTDWEPGWFYWNTGTDYLPDVASFRAFARLVKTDATLGALFTKTAPHIANVDHFAFDATRAEYLSLTRTTVPTYGAVTGPSIHWTMLYPVMNPPDDPRAPGEGKRAAVCSYLDTAQRARQP